MVSPHPPSCSIIVVGNVFDLTEPCDSDLEVSAQSDQECPGPALPVLVLDPVSYILTVSPWHTVTLANCSCGQTWSMACLV